MSSDINEAAVALDYLKRDCLRHVMLLKYWQAFARHVRVQVARDGWRIGVCLLVPGAVSPYDAKTYPRARFVAFVRADTPELARVLVESLPQEDAIIFKLIDPIDVEAVRAVFPVLRQTSFITFSATGQRRGWQAHAEVRTASRPPPGALPLYAQQGYEAAELNLYANEQQGRFHIVAGKAGGIVGVCFSFQNFERIHEIGGLFTLPQARRSGIARRLVETALAALQDHNLIPRYQVHEENMASIALAQALGLEPAVTAEHWLYEA